ncbi:MAG: DoxX family protein [Patescibacteria group bacterium]
MHKYFKKYHSPDAALLLLRLGLAAVFIMHGWPKIQNPEVVGGFFSSLGLNMFWVYVVAYVEFLGGIAMLIGLFSRWAGFLLAIDMLFAIYLVRWPRGFVGGYEFEFLLLLAALAIHLAGPGKYSISEKS